jgi:hypothetical protein
MNIAKVKNSADFVNYVKPGLEMIGLETEDSLLLTASGGEVRFGAGVSGAGNAVPGAGSSGKWSSRPSAGNNAVSGASNSGIWRN